MIIYSINDFVTSDATLVAASERASITLRPFIGDDADVAPIFLYQYSPDIKNGDQYYIHTDRVWYTILDTDVDRGFRLQKIIIDLLNRADQIQSQAIDDTYGRLLYMQLNRTVQRQPETVDGYYQLSSLFDFCWVPQD